VGCACEDRGVHGHPAAGCAVSEDAGESDGQEGVYCGVYGDACDEGGEWVVYGECVALVSTTYLSVWGGGKGGVGGEMVD